MKLLAFAILFSLVSTGCGRNSNSYVRTPISSLPPSGSLTVPYYVAEKTAFTQLGHETPVDYLYSIDNSAAMDSFAPALEKSLRGFVEGLIKVHANFQIGMVTASEAPYTASGTALQGPRPILGRNDPDAVAHVLENLKALRSSPSSSTLYPVERLTTSRLDSRNAALFRSGAAHHFLVAVSGADESPYARRKLPVYVNELQLASASIPWQVIGIGSPSDHPCPSAESLGQALLEGLVAARGGALGRVCDDDYSQILLSTEDAASALLADFHLTPSLKGTVDPGTLVVKTNGQVQTASAYQWAPKLESIHFSSTAVPAEGQQVEVEYEIEVF